MFNTTLQNQTFQVPQAFLPLLGPNDPTSITIYAAAPGLDGTPNPNAPPGGQVYVSASIQAQITIGGSLTLDGFIQIQIAGSTNGIVQLNITGAVGTQIPYLGSLSGQLSWTYFLGPQLSDDGVVGRVFLTLNSSSIPGVALSGTSCCSSTGSPPSRRSRRSPSAPPPAAASPRCGNTTPAATSSTPTTITTVGGFDLQMSGVLTVAGIADQRQRPVQPPAGRHDRGQPACHRRDDAVAARQPNVANGGFHVDAHGLSPTRASLGAGGFGPGVGLGFGVTATLSLNTTGQIQINGSAPCARASRSTSSAPSTSSGSPRVPGRSTSPSAPVAFR